MSVASTSNVIGADNGVSTGLGMLETIGVIVGALFCANAAGWIAMVAAPSASFKIYLVMPIVMLIFLVPSSNNLPVSFMVKSR